MAPHHEKNRSVPGAATGSLRFVEAAAAIRRRACARVLSFGWEVCEAALPLAAGWEGG